MKLAVEVRVTKPGDTILFVDKFQFTAYFTSSWSQTPVFHKKIFGAEITKEMT